MTHLLVVDNNPAISEILKEALESEPIYRVTSASSGLQALEMMARDRPDAAIIDVLMPGMSGIELAGHVLGIGVPVLLISGNFETTAELERIGCQVLPKPFRIAQLLAETKALLAAAGDRRAELIAQLRRLKANISEQAEAIPSAKATLRASQYEGVTLDQLSSSVSSDHCLTPYRGDHAISARVHPVGQGAASRATSAANRAGIGPSNGEQGGRRCLGRHKH